MPEKINLEEEKDKTPLGSSDITWWGMLSQGLDGFQISVHITLADIVRHTKVTNVESLQAEGLDPAGSVQRELIPNHARELADYILSSLNAGVLDKATKGKLGEYSEEIATYAEVVKGWLPDWKYYTMAPIVLTGRDDLYSRVSQAEHGELAHRRLIQIDFESGYRFDTSDGNHRRVAIGHLCDLVDFIDQKNKFPGKEDGLTPLSAQAMKKLKTMAPICDREKGDPVQYSKLGAREYWLQILEEAKRVRVNATILPIQGKKDEQWSTYVATNLKPKRPEKGLGERFDLSNPISNYFKECENGMDHFCAITKRNVKVTIPRLTDKDIVTWPNGGKTLARTKATRICSFVATGKGSSKNLRSFEFEESKDLVNKFWILIQSLPHMQSEDAMKHTLVAQPVMQEAIARLLWEVQENVEKDPELVDHVIAQIYERARELFTHDSDIFLPYQEDGSLREGAPQSHLPPHKEGVNRFTGGRDSSKLIRFDAKVNDVRPRLVDILRFKLDLVPNKGRGLPA